jgi:hypothetical protein
MLASPFLISLAIATGASANDSAGAIENIEHEVSESIQDGFHSINSKTLVVARKMCAMVAYQAYGEKAITAEEYLEAHANCAKGNLHTVFSKLGGDLMDDRIAVSVELKRGVKREISEWEQDAMQAWHMVKPERK